MSPSFRSNSYRKKLWFYEQKQQNLATTIFSKTPIACTSTIARMYDISDCLSIHLPSVAITVTASTNWRFNQVDGIAAKKTLPEIRTATIQVCANDAL